MVLCTYTVYIEAYRRRVASPPPRYSAELTILLLKTIFFRLAVLCFLYNNPARSCKGRDYITSVRDLSRSRVTTANHFYLKVLLYYSIHRDIIWAIGASSRPFSHRQSYIKYYIYICQDSRPGGFRGEGRECAVRPSYTIPRAITKHKKSSFSETVVARVKSVHKSDVFTPWRVRKT